MAEIETGVVEDPPERCDIRAYATDGEYSTYWELTELETTVSIEYLRGDEDRDLIETDGPAETLVGAAGAVEDILDGLLAQGEQAVEHAQEYWDGPTPETFEHGPASRRRVLPSGYGWRARGQALHEHGDIPETRARAVALLETGRSHREVADVLEMARANVGTHVRRYREDDLDPAQWLVEHGPEV